MDFVFPSYASPTGDRLNCREQGRQPEGALVPDVVDEEGRRHGDTASDASPSDAPDLLGVDVGEHLAAEPNQVQADLRRMPLEPDPVPRSLAFEQGSCISQNLPCEDAHSAAWAASSECRNCSGCGKLR